MTNSKAEATILGAKGDRFLRVNTSPVTARCFFSHPTLDLLFPLSLRLPIDRAIAAALYLSPVLHTMTNGNEAAFFFEAGLRAVLPWHEGKR